VTNQRSNSNQDQVLELKSAVFLAIITSVLTTAGTFSVVKYQASADKNAWLFQQDYMEKKEDLSDKEGLRDSLVSLSLKSAKANSKVFTLAFQNTINAMNPVYPDDALYARQKEIGKEFVLAMDNASELHTDLIESLVKSKSLFSGNVGSEIDEYFVCAQGRNDDLVDNLIDEFFSKYSSGEIDKSNFLDKYSAYSLKAGELGAQFTCQEGIADILGATTIEISSNK
jgi:hypothetical protein